jgi:hypothetical protein
MPNELPSTFSGGQQLKAESFSKAIYFEVSSVALPLPLPLIGAMQASEQPSAPRTGNDGKHFPIDSLFALPVKYQASAVSTLKTKQSWEGTVISCENGGFTARVIDRTNPGNPDESVLFEFDEVSTDDRQLIHPGAVFYWTLGTERSPAGQIRNVNFVNFRRLPGWNESSFQEADKRAQRVLSLFSQE